MANVEMRRDEYTFLGSGCNIRTHLLRAAARPRVYFIKRSAEMIWARDGCGLTTRSKYKGNSAVKQNPADSLKNTHLWVVAPHLEFVV